MSERLLTRTVLRYAADLRGIPQSFEEIHNHVAGRLRRPAHSETVNAIATLETLGYLARSEATAADEPLYTITASGLRQALKQVPAAQLDPMIWGD